MTITQTIDIPADRRITVPREVPTGRTIINFTPASAVKHGSAVAISSEKQGEAAVRNTPRADRLLGAATGLGDISLDEIRDERLSQKRIMLNI
ncbi:MAG: hypothetical protein FWB95_09550 [Treponema sp.]|nr:hypothetical protein [Treponema sp.]